MLEFLPKIVMALKQVFALRVQSKTSCMLMCQAHLILTLLSETKYLCTSQSDGDFFIESLCKSFYRIFIANHVLNSTAKICVNYIHLNILIIDSLYFLLVF